jgi:antitoxin Phd
MRRKLKQGPDDDSRQPTLYIGHIGYIGHYKESFMIAVTSVEAQSRFGELIDRAQREPIEITRRGRPVAYVISEHDIKELQDVRKRREDAVRWYASYKQHTVPTAEAVSLTDADINRLVHELR